MLRRKRDPQDEGLGGSKSFGRQAGRVAANRRRFVVWILLVGTLLEPACLFKKKGGGEMKFPAAPVRCVTLPLNIPADNPDLTWISTAATYIMARLLEEVPDLDAVALWESMPIAAESVGDTRTITSEAAAYVASRLGARWAIQGDLLPAKKGMSLRIDFIPTRASQVAFRYERAFTPENMEQRIRDAFVQFLRYLIARPLPKKTTSSSLSDLKVIGEALDQEYGWRTQADPGKAEKLAAELASSQKEVARLLFNPTLYPVLRPTPSEPRPPNQKNASR